MTTHTHINGSPVTLHHDPADAAVEAIRDKAGLTGTKLVCGAGVCGACTVLVDGKPAASCCLPACSLEGKQVQTIEQFDRDNLHPVQKAFLVHDGLQCGFCTPGFIVEAIYFYDRWRDQNGTDAPSRETIAAAMAGHLCRCGAYEGIYRAIQTACRGDFDDVEADDLEFARHEGIAKVTGEAKYTFDVTYDGMLVAKFLSSPHPHAKVVGVDTSVAEQISGVEAVVDVLEDPHRVVRYAGQPILAVAAIDEATAIQALDAIEIEYEVFPFVVDPVTARQSDAPVVYPESKKLTPNASEGPIPPGFWKGNVRTPLTNQFFSSKKSKARKALAAARSGEDGLHLVEHTFSTPAQTHTSLEPHVCVANWDGRKLTVHSSTQSVHLLGKEIAKHFKIPRSDVTVHAEFIGGAFGSKQGLILEIKTAVALAMKTNRPVKLAFTRDEEMVMGGFRPTSEIEMALVVDDDANQRGITAKAWGCCGTAVQSQNAPWIRLLYSGPKDLKDFDVLTNWASARPFRGPCGPSAFWALEQSVDQAASDLKMDPIALRRKWDPDSVRSRLYDWAESIDAWKQRPETGSQSSRFRTGVGVAIGNWFNAFWSGTQVKLELTTGGLVASCAVQDMGQGSRSVIGKAIAETLGVSFHDVDVQIGNSDFVPGPISSGSRTTASIYPTSIEAASMMREQIVSAARTKLALKNPRWTEGKLSYDSGSMDIAELADKLAPLTVTSKKRGSNGLWDVMGKLPSGDLGMNFTLSTTGSVCLVQLSVDTLLGKIIPEKVWMGMAVGKITNPILARSQTYGGIIQSLGITLSEERKWCPTTGTLLSFGMEDYRIPGIGDVPEMEVFFDEFGFENIMKGGACGMAELSNVPVSAAVGNAVYNATKWRPTVLPLTPERVIRNVAG